MAHLDHSSAVTIITALLQREFPALRRIELAPSTPLLSAGLLDSFAVVTLIASLEEAFHVEIDVDTTELESFESIDTIAALIAKERGRSG